mmetsp:Transcript_6668/g.16053  ORF Transcript_6668/g.16053 Transcript_6668/m.16053 type:complete len:271 (-) Transcript_6668:1851-2663(-)
MVRRRGFKPVDIPVHGGEHEVKAAVAVEVVREHHRIRSLPNIDRVCTPCEAVNHVEQSIKGGDDKVLRSCALEELHDEHGRHHAPSGPEGKVRDLLPGLPVDGVDVARPRPKHDLELAVAVDVARRGHLRDYAADVALPQLVALVVEEGAVPARVAHKDLEEPVAVDVGNEGLALDLAHLDRPPLPGLPLAVQHVEEAHGGANNDLEAPVTVDVGNSRRGVDVGTVLGEVGRQVEMLRPLDCAAVELIDDNAARDVVGDVDVVAELHLVV